MPDFLCHGNNGMQSDPALANGQRIGLVLSYPYRED